MLADHGRGDDVPAGRRRRALERGARLRAAPDHAPRDPAGPRRSASSEPFLPALCAVVVETMGDAYPELRAEQRDTIARWAPAEEESFGRTLEQGERLLGRARRAAREEGTSWVAAEDAFRLHDTYGFPYEMTKELLAEEGLAVDDQGFEELMEQRARASRAAGARDARGGGGMRPGGASSRARRRLPDALRRLRDDRGRTRSCARSSGTNGRVLAKLEEQPVLPRGRRPGLGRRAGRDRLGRARRSWTSTASATTRRSRSSRSRASSAQGEPAQRRGRARRAPRDACATTPRRTCCTRRCASGSARTSARRAPTSARTSCASTSRTASDCRREELRRRRGAGERLDRRATTRCGRSRPRATRPSARRDGAVRREVRRLGADGRDRGRSRASCAAAPTSRSTAEIGLFHVTGETSSASNVRRIEAVTGPAARRCSARAPRRCASSRRCCACPRTRWSRAVERLQQRVKELREAAPRAAPTAARPTAASPAARGGRRRARAWPRPSSAPTPRRCSTLSDRVRQKLGDAAVVLGRPSTAACTWWRTFAPAAVERGVKAGDVVRAAARGRRRRRRRPRHHGAGGRPRSREAARGAGGGARGDRAGARRLMPRILALDHGAARCGCAVSDPSGTLATPLAAVERPGHEEGPRRAGARWWRSRAPSAWSWACR